MSNSTGRRTTNPSDPTAERTADPLPEGEDIIARDRKPQHTTPRRYDEQAEDPVMPADDSTLKTQI